MFTHCQECHKQLKNPVYQAIGYGAVCLSKMFEEGEDPEFDTEEQERAYRLFKKSIQRWVYCNHYKMVKDASDSCSKFCEGFKLSGNKCIHRFKA